MISYSMRKVRGCLTLQRFREQRLLSLKAALVGNDIDKSDNSGMTIKLQSNLVDDNGLLSAQEFRKSHQINIRGASAEALATLNPITSFLLTPFSPKLQHVLKSEGYESPTPTQAQSWPIALAKRDLISVARTGSGKTCGFLLPAIHNILSSSTGVPRFRKKPRVLVLSPTRELTLQIEKEAQKFARACGLGVVAVYGGTSKGMQVHIGCMISLIYFPTACVAVGPRTSNKCNS